MTDRVHLDPLVILGPTASGKSELAFGLAQRVGAEIISADAMAVYRGLDIGTAKPSPEARQTVRHHLVDVADPAEPFTLSQFLELADRAVADCAERGVPAVVVGGTGLYVHAVVDGYDVPPQFPELRQRLDAEPDTGAMWQRLAQLDPAAADKMEPTNRRRIVRALEVVEGTGRPFSSFGPGVSSFGPTRFRLAGLEVDRTVMDRRIDERFDAMMAAGLFDEVGRVAPMLGQTASQALGYRELAAVWRGDAELEDAVAEAKRRTRRFARRQQRWFRRDPRIVWFGHDRPDLADAVWRFWRSEPDNDGPAVGR